MARKALGSMLAPIPFTVLAHSMGYADGSDDIPNLLIHTPLMLGTLVGTYYRIRGQYRINEAENRVLNLKDHMSDETFNKIKKIGSGS